jgi:hypothetical protein
MTEFVQRIPDSFHHDCERCMAAALGEDVESFAWGAYRWDVAKAKKIASDGRSPVAFQTEELRQLGSLVLLDDEHVGHVPIDEPIIIIRFPVTNHGSQRGLFPIDGSHRIARRARMNLATTLGYVLSEEESDSCRTDDRAPRPRRRARRTPRPS